MVLNHAACPCGGMPERRREESQTVEIENSRHEGRWVRIVGRERAEFEHWRSILGGTLYPLLFHLEPRKCGSGDWLAIIVKVGVGGC
jgi:hypothetical protein